MNAVVICLRNKTEGRMVHDVFRSVAGFCLDDAWTVRHAASKEELYQVLADGATAQICFADITGANGLTMAELVRKLFALAQLVLVVEPSAPPTSYIRPGILPAGLLFKPLTTEALCPLIRELLQVIKRKEQEEIFHDETFPVLSHGATYRIPLRDILYFEARNKKLYLYTENSEIEFYDTLEQILCRLPKEFLRCHKSFVVNQTAVEQVALAQGRLTMCGGRIELPISRSCKSAVKEALL